MNQNNLFESYVKRTMRKIYRGWKEEGIEVIAPLELRTTAAYMLTGDSQVPDTWEKWAEEVIEQFNDPLFGSAEDKDYFFD